MKERCTEWVYSGARHDFGGHRCTKPVVKDKLCKIHQPEYVAAKRAETDARQKAKWEADRRREALCAIPTLREMGYTVIEPPKE